MKDFEIVLSETPEMDHPFLLEGLPGIGNVGRIATEHLIALFGARKLGEILSTSFPHQVKNLPDGTVRLMRNELYFTESPREMLYLTGDMQPLPTDFKSHYRMAESILDLCERFRVELIITIGGYGLGGGDGQSGQVFAAASSPGVASRFEEVGLEFLKEDPGVPIVGISGLIPALASTRGIDAICLLGRTSGDIRPDSEAAKAVLDKIASVLGIEIDTSNVPKVAEAIEKEMDDIIKRIERLERQKPGATGREGYIY